MTEKPSNRLQDKSVNEQTPPWIWPLIISSQDSGKLKLDFLRQFV